MTYYITEVGTITDAVRYITKFGGQIIRSKNAHSIIVRRGCYEINFVSEKFNHELLEQNALALGFKPFRGMTEGKLIRKFLAETIRLEPKGTYFGRTIQKFSEGGWHWGYYHYIPHEPGDYIELDVKAAYLSSLLTFPSFFFHQPMSWDKNPNNAVQHFVQRVIHGGQFSQNETYAWKNDGGALNRLRAYQDTLPKELRLKLVGIIASQKFNVSYLNEDEILVDKTIRRINWGAAFNAVQLAVLRLYYTAQEAVEIAGEYCVRWHTDGGIFRADMPREIEDRLINLFRVRGFTLRCKSVGLGYFWDLNTGYLGDKNPCGNKEEVLALMRTYGLKFRENDITDALVERWWHLLVTHELELHNRTVYGFFQKRYSADEEGILYEDGGTFYCFCCHIKPVMKKYEGELYESEFITAEKVQQYLKSL